MKESLFNQNLDQKITQIIKTQTTEDYKVFQTNEHSTKGKVSNIARNKSAQIQIKKNLFNIQQKENLPQWIQRIDKNSQQTLRILSNKSENQENMKWLMNANDEMLLTLKVPFSEGSNNKQQPEQLLKGMNILKQEYKKEMQNWKKSQTKLNEEISNNKEINKRLSDENAKLKDKVSCLQILKVRLSQENTILLQQSKRLKDKQTQQKSVNSYNNLNGLQSTDPDTDTEIVQRLLKKVQLISLELEYYMKLSLEYKRQNCLNNNLLKQKELLVKSYINQIHALRQNANRISQCNQNQIQNINSQLQEQRQRTSVLLNQLNRYKQQYESLKKRHLMMQGQLRKNNLSKQHKKLIDQHSQLKRVHNSLSDRYCSMNERYNKLFMSYKSLYQQYTNESNDRDFIHEVMQDSNSGWSGIGEGKGGMENDYYGEEGWSGQGQSNQNIEDGEGGGKQRGMIPIEQSSSSSNNNSSKNEIAGECQYLSRDRQQQEQEQQQQVQLRQLGQRGRVFEKGNQKDQNDNKNLHQPSHHSHLLLLNFDNRKDRGTSQQQQNRSGQKRGEQFVERKIMLQQLIKKSMDESCRSRERAKEKRR